jgi:hypothetical protein
MIDLMRLALVAVYLPALFNHHTTTTTRPTVPCVHLEQEEGRSSLCEDIVEI